MSVLDGLVNVSIASVNATPQVANSSTPAFKHYHTLNGDYIRTYGSAAAWVTDGGSLIDPAGIWLTTIFSQSPRPPSAKIIRGSTSVQQTFTMLVTDAAVGDTIGFSCIGVDGTTTVVNTTSTGTVATDAATLQALTAPNGCTMAVNTATITVTVTSSGKIVYPFAVKGCTFVDTTAAATNNALDLTNALGVDSAWYGITDEHQDHTNIAVIAAWAESNKRLHVYTNAETAALGSATGIGNTLKTAGYTYSFGMYSGSPQTYGASALEAQRFTAVPGSDSWAYKQLAGVAADNLTGTQITNLNGNNLNYYLANVAGVNVTLNGIDASGMYADLRRGIDALASQIQINVYTLLISMPKVPYDAFGYAAIGGQIAAALQQFTATASNPFALLRSDPGFTWTVIPPATSAATTADRGNRVLRNFTFTAYAQQAAQTIFISGTVNA